MRQINIDPILEKIEAALRQHEISPGCYTRWTRQPEQSPHPLGPNPYACADAAAILHILNRFGLPTHTEQTPAALTDAALSDKKRSGGTIRLILPREIGDCFIHSLPAADLEDFIKKGL